MSASLAQYRDHVALIALPTFEEMIVTGACWDLVDDIGLVGARLRQHPRKMKSSLLRWARDRDMWKRLVSRYLSEHEDRMSPLSKREATKNMAP